MAIFDQASTALGTGMNVASAVNPAMMGLGMIPEAFKLGLGVTQALRARKIEKSQQRPVFNIPGAAQNAMAGQYNLASGQAPGLNTAMQQLAQAQAGSINAVQNSGGGGAERLAALTMLDQNAGNQAQQLGATQQQWQAQQQANLINQQNQYADWQQRAWEYNKYKPYEQAMAKAAELRNAANTNIYGAAKSTGGLISSALKGPKATINADGSPGPVAPVATPPDPTKEYQSLLGIGDPTMPRDSVMGKTITELAKDVAAEDAVISDPNGLIQDPNGLINRRSNPTSAGYSPIDPGSDINSINPTIGAVSELPANYARNKNLSSILANLNPSMKKYAYLFK